MSYICESLLLTIEYIGIYFIWSFSKLWRLMARPHRAYSYTWGFHGRMRYAGQCMPFATLSSLHKYLGVQGSMV